MFTKKPFTKMENDWYRESSCTPNMLYENFEKDHAWCFDV